MSATKEKLCIMYLLLENNTSAFNNGKRIDYVQYHSTNLRYFSLAFVSIKVPKFV